MAIPALTPIRISSLLMDSSQIAKAASRLDFDPRKRSEELRGRAPIENVPADQVHRRRAFALSEGAVSIDLERINGGNDLMSFNYLERGMLAGRSVGRVLVRDNTGDLVAFGTGFLISSQLLITNHHVLGSLAEAEKSQMEFNFQMDTTGRPVESEIFGLSPERFFFTHEDLDFTVVAIQAESTRGAALVQFGFLPLIAEPGKVLESEYVSCIEHPGGKYKEVALRENQILKKLDHFLWYKTDTAPGSSGSPIFNDSWQVVALHHAGAPNKDANGNILARDGTIWGPEMGDDKVDWVANEGVRISSIVAELTKSCGNNPLLKAAIPISGSPVIEISSKPRPTAVRRTVGPQSAPAVSAPRPALPQPTELTVPLNLKLTIGDLTGVAIAPAEDIKAERVSKEKGYNETFLGTKLSAPRLNAEQQADAVQLNRSSLIPYTHFSVCLSKSRRMAYFSAWNINGDQLKTYGRNGLQFKLDPNIDSEYQIGNDAYSDNKLDRGHLARRADIVWGSKAEAQEANRQSFFYTNITPQHQSFNQSEKHGLWGILEDAIFEDVSVDDLRVSVLAGPIFKANDIEYRGIRIPCDFWKVLAYVDAEDGKLKVWAYVLTQKNLLDDLEALSLDPFRLYQVSLNQLQTTTGLSFDEWCRADTFTSEMATEGLVPGGKRPVREVKSRKDIVVYV